MSPISESVQAKMACLRQISFAEFDKAVDAAQLLAKKTGRVVETHHCPICRGYHNRKQGES